MEEYECWHLPIFPGRHHPSIFGTIELNFRVRHGNGWTLWERVDPRRHQHQLFHGFSPLLFSDSWGNRTPVTGVRGRCLNRLTNEPCSGGPKSSDSEPHGAPSGTRTRDTLIKSQVLYQLS